MLQGWHGSFQQDQSDQQHVTLRCARVSRARAFLNFISGPVGAQRLILAGMLADASDEALLLTRAFDDEAADPALTQVAVRQFMANIQMLLVQQHCVSMGFIQACGKHLGVDRKRTVPNRPRRRFACVRPADMFTTHDWLCDHCTYCSPRLVSGLGSNCCLSGFCIGGPGAESESSFCRCMELWFALSAVEQNFSIQNWLTSKRRNVGEQHELDLLQLVVVPNVDETDLFHRASCVWQQLYGKPRRTSRRLRGFYKTQQCPEKSGPQPLKMWLRSRRKKQSRC